MRYLKYYWNPLIFSTGTAAFFSPFYLPMERGNLIGPIFALFMILVLWGVWAWVVALGQLLKAMVNFRKPGTDWQHHGASALWTYTCYGILITLVLNGYFPAV